MHIKIVKAYSRCGFVNSKTHLFPDYLVESAVPNPGIKAMLNNLKIKWKEAGEIREGKINLSDFGKENIKYASEIIKFNSQLRDHISDSIKTGDDFPLMVGGDHSSSIGSIAGILQKRPDIGVFWLDAHADIHTDKTTETGWIYGMPAAVICGKGHPDLLKIMKGRFVKPENLCLFGVRYTENGEWENIKKWGVNIITVDDIDEVGIYEAYGRAMSSITRNTSKVHVSLDIDVIDKMYAPGGTEPTQGGLTFREINFIARKLGESGLVKSMDVVEGEPDKDVNFQTGKLCLQLIANVLGKRYSEYDTYLNENQIGV